ncbi:hypothetical protein ACFFU1_13355 [Algibacter miyuki]|uniref:SGNH/GDSL hydrolase family protein n=1 Tax=Algibacter miyuki TaxID=1306933 RepID=A0ABV5H1W9_9FLAO|nr:hypothetical protein [Algibacter miyuki]MDN3666500.1 hypothetical protein [Algibacter miyuki]
MARFIKYTLVVVLLVIGVLFTMDTAYVLIYKKSQSRNKLQYILKTKQEHFDVVFLGSSRVANHIDTKLFDSLSGKKTINLGIMGGQLNDNLLQLKLLLVTNTISSVYLQLDDNFERTAPTVMGTAAAMPFIRNDIIHEHAKKYFNNFNKLYYIPFYRYGINDAKIGFRELFFSLLQKKPRIDPSVGFNPKFGSILKNKGSLPSSISIGNAVLDEIKTICKSQNIELTLFIAPYAESVKNRSYIWELKRKNPELLDFSAGYPDSLFYNFSHLNNKGAQIFTKNLYDKTLKGFRKL